MTFSTKRKPVRSHARSHSRKRHNSGRRSSKHAATHRRPSHSRKAARKSASRSRQSRSRKAARKSGRRSRQNHGSRRLRGGGVNKGMVATAGISAAATVLAGLQYETFIMNFIAGRLQDRISILTKKSPKSEKEIKELREKKQKRFKLLQIIDEHKDVADAVAKDPTSPVVLEDAEDASNTATIVIKEIQQINGRPMLQAPSEKTKTFQIKDDRVSTTPRRSISVAPYTHLETKHPDSK